jgi:hypothetical protein
MKKLALMIAFVLLPLAIQASAADISTDTSTTAVEQQTGRPVAPVMLASALIPYCSAVQDTSCTPSVSVSTTSCTDLWYNKLSCTCTSAHVWSCSAAGC